MTKFSHLKPKNETKAQAMVRIADFSRFGAMAQILIVDALGAKFGNLEYTGRESNMDKIKQALKFAPTATVKAVEERAQGIKAAGLEKVREQFAKSGNGLIHPDAWHGVAVEIADALASCDLPAKAAA